jgi:hypothetical protein
MVATAFPPVLARKSPAAVGLLRPRCRWSAEEVTEFLVEDPYDVI